MPPLDHYKLLRCILLLLLVRVCICCARTYIRLHVQVRKLIVGQLGVVHVCCVLSHADVGEGEYVTAERD